LWYKSGYVLKKRRLFDSTTVEIGSAGETGIEIGSGIDIGSGAAGGSGGVAP